MTIARVFVANRGEIAVRIVRACRALGLEAVVGVSDVDRDSAAARLADRAVCIGPARATESYLQARDDRAGRARHGLRRDPPRLRLPVGEPAPRRGSRARRACAFVGPPAEVIELAGDKLAARAKAAEAGLPLVPGGEVATLDEAERFAARVRLPGAAQGGGRRRRARHQARCDAGRARRAVRRRGRRGRRRRSATRASTSSASSPPRATSRCRSRPTSTAPSSTSASATARSSAATRRSSRRRPRRRSPPSSARRCTTAAVAFARAIGYVNLGTVEFMVDAATGEHFFLECNCRIQVEHPVTEEVTGRDLVAEQLRIAAGEPLSFAQDGRRARRPRGRGAAHGRGRRARLPPEPGRLARFAVPDVAGLRVDTHCADGTLIPPYYDSLHGQAHRPRPGPRERRRRARRGARPASRSRASQTNRDAAARRARARGLRDRRGHDPLARGGGARVSDSARRSRSSTRRCATATSRSGARPASRRPTSSRSRRPSTASASARATSPRARTWRCRSASTARTRGSACGSRPPRCRARRCR